MGKGNRLVSRVGIVVPTLGKRPDFLKNCLTSIVAASKQSGEDIFLVLVTPKGTTLTQSKEMSFVNEIVDDPGLGLAAAINSGFAAMPSSIEYINWLGDDDLVSGDSIRLAVGYLDISPKSVMVFGGCEYIDSNDKVLWVNQSGQYAVPLLRFGPDLVPQPGALFRKKSFHEVGGLDSRYHWAFDFDLFMKLSKIGKLKHLNFILASFRWHPESLSVEYRVNSVNEASRVRVSHLPERLVKVSFIWEAVTRMLTLVAGNMVSRKSQESSS